ncbi:sigma-54-dependent Fis family transcriptional regulator [candidate division WOR-3 bacterium]|nr:sigma-54-dependent Fis family transcriptional regulator [candidate division WOR-3 bacterium]
MSEKILIVDDETGLLKVVSMALSQEGFQTVECDSGVEAISKMEKENFDIVISDLKMPRLSGLELLEKVKRDSPNTGFILLSAYATLESAIQGLRLGADDYLQKPFDLSELITRVRSVIEKNSLRRETQYLRRRFTENEKQIIGLEGGLSLVTEKLKKVAPTDATVLLTGETGTGKDVIAKLIHKWSFRKNKSFIPVNCAAIPETLLERELFGHKKGSYTGAHEDKDGLFKIADGGTLFLDEIGDIPLSTQVKVLRAIQEKEINPLGSTASVKTDVRIIVATNRDLKKLVEENRFREDLYYRVNVINIEIPPLRFRKQDIVNLALYFTELFSKKHGIKRKLSKKSESFLVNKPWKGNVRELENLIEKAVILSEQEVINLYDFKEDLSEESGSFSGTLDVIERETIFKTLKACKNNKNKAAKILGIDVSTLYRKMKKYDFK